ncbi:MAG: prenyltransferase [Deltaproteobacteria bacterium]|nr:prenyltransferase [Deltaproteobacteria bacterium]
MTDNNSDLSDHNLNNQNQTAQYTQNLPSETKDTENPPEYLLGLAKKPELSPENPDLSDKADRNGPKAQAKPETDSEAISSAVFSSRSPEKSEAQAAGNNRKRTLLEWLKIWLRASRAPFFIATVFPLALGYTAAYKLTGTSSPGLFVIILLASFSVHLATNLANDYFEYTQGVDNQNTIGGTRVLQDGVISPKQIKTALFICYSLSFILGIIIVGKNIALWCLVAIAALSSYFYVAPPVKYGHRALGELSVFINMGLIMTVGTQAAISGYFIRETCALGLIIAFMVAGILYYQSLPEIETDPLSGKITLAVVLGKDRSCLVYLLWWPFIWLLMITVYLARLVEWPVLLGLLSIPLHVAACRRFKTVGNWLELDKHGHLIRKLYAANSLALILGLALR